MTFILAASIGLGTPDAKLVAVVAAHVNDSRVADPVPQTYTPSAVRPLCDAFGRSALPEVDLLPLYNDLPPHFRTRP